MMKIASMCLAGLLAGCAAPTTVSTSQVRTGPPANVEATVTSYFDLMASDVQPNRRLSFGTPEASRCALIRGGGTYLGWVVPVIDSSPTSSLPAVSASASTSAADGKPMTTASGTTSASLDEVSITGTRYFFWFSNSTISAVTRRMDVCP